MVQANGNLQNRDVTWPGMRTERREYAQVHAIRGVLSPPLDCLLGFTCVSMSREGVSKLHDFC